MDPLAQLYERLRAQWPPRRLPLEPSAVEDWLEYWNDDQSEIANLRTFEHWLSRPTRP